MQTFNVPSYGQRSYLLISHWLQNIVIKQQYRFTMFGFLWILEEEACIVSAELRWSPPWSFPSDPILLYFDIFLC